jgi:hypothetical protein
MKFSVSSYGVLKLDVLFLIVFLFFIICFLIFRRMFRLQTSRPLELLAGFFTLRMAHCYS